jgi:hypothetical protein
MKLYSPVQHCTIFMKKPREIKVRRLADMGVPQRVVDRLTDLSEAGREMRVGRVIAEALEMFIEKEIRENEGIARRFNELQKQRRGDNNPGIRLIQTPPESD